MPCCGQVMKENQLREELGGGCEVLGTRLEVEAPRGTRYLMPPTHDLATNTLLFSQFQRPLFVRGGASEPVPPSFSLSSRGIWNFDDAYARAAVAGDAHVHDRWRSTADD